MYYQLSGMSVVAMYGGLADIHNSQTKQGLLHNCILNLTNTSLTKLVDDNESLIVEPNNEAACLEIERSGGTDMEIKGEARL